MRITPHHNFRFAGLGYLSPALDCSKVYTATPATNQPDFKSKGLVFVSFDNDGEEPSIMLASGDYSIVEN